MAVGTTTFVNPALDVHWGMEKTYDFYKNVFSRISYDGNASIIFNYVAAPSSWGGMPNNAYANQQFNYMVYGMGDGSLMDPVVGLDILGHEFTHLVIANNGRGGLTYVGESGALNESFADIMGTCVEFYAKGNSANWTMGENIMLNSPYYFRSMSSPSTTSLSATERQPNTYGGNYWGNPSCSNPVQGLNDNCGVHRNSGVQNFWFYLLCQGGSGTNDNGYNYSVSGIGISNAQKIAYRNFMTYLTPNANYADARQQSIQSAIDLFGESSSYVQSVKDAWCAVGVGSCSANPTTINELQNDFAVEIYPNPNNGLFTIKIDEITKADLLVADLMGRKVFQTKTTSNITTVDLSNYEKGMYIVTINESDKRTTKKVVIH